MSGNVNKPKQCNKQLTASTNNKHHVQESRDFMNNELVLKNNLAYLSTIRNMNSEIQCIERFLLTTGYIFALNISET